MGAHEPVALPGHAQVCLGFGIRTDEVRRTKHLHDRPVLQAVPRRGDLGPQEERVFLLQVTEAPGLHRLTQQRPGPRIRDGEGLLGFRWQWHPVFEHALQILHQQIAPAPDAVGGQLGADQRHGGVDHPQPERVRDRHSVVTVPDEVHVADPVNGDRWHRLPAPVRCVDPLPALPHCGRRRPELAVEGLRLVDRADDGFEPDRLDAEGPLPRPA